MKKIFLTFIFATLLIFAKAQTLTSFVQAGIGFNVESGRGYLIFAEYGKTWKWLDVSLSADYESMFPLGESYSGGVTFYKNGIYHIDIDNHYGGVSQIDLMLNARIDIIKFFTANSRHALKIGGGLGYAIEQHVESQRFPYDSTLDYSLDANSTYCHLYVQNKNLWTGALRASYEFDITPKLTLGAFFRGSYMPCIGLSIRRNF